MIFPKSNTKIFNNLEELWNYCGKCIICSSFRNVEVSLGPDEVFIPKSLNKTEGNLLLGGIVKTYNNKLDILFNIDCNQNIFNYTILSEEYEINESKNAENPYLYFYINAFCYACDKHITSTLDIELNVLNKKIKTFGLEEETIFLKNKEEIYRFCIDYFSKTVDIEIINGKNKKSIQIPFIDYDFSNKEKLVQKIKTIITFG